MAPVATETGALTREYQGERVRCPVTIGFRVTEDRIMSTPLSYSRAQIVLHWAVVVLMGASYISSDAMKDAWRALAKGIDAYGTVAFLHVAGGIAILALALLRMVIRRQRGAPAELAGTSPLMARVARLTHLGLYGAMVLVPAAGLLAWYGGIKAMGEVHEVLFNLSLALIGLHVAAAAFHQWVMRDGLLLRMWRAR